MAENSTPTTRNTTTEAKSGPKNTFSQLMDGIKNSVNEFQENMTPENFARIITALGAMGFSGANIMRGTADYVRRHPVQVALGAGLIFYALKGLLGDERQLSQRESSYH